METFLIVIGATTIAVIVLYSFIFLASRILYSIGKTVFHLRLVKWNNLSGKRWKTFKFILKLTFESFFESHVSSARAKHLSWEPYFKFTDHRNPKDL